MHGDQNASLSIRQDDDMRWLLACRAGYSFDTILAAVGIDPRGFGPDADPPRRSKE